MFLHIGPKLGDLRIWTAALRLSALNGTGAISVENVAVHFRLLLIVASGQQKLESIAFLCQSRKVVRKLGQIDFGRIMVNTADNSTDIVERERNDAGLCVSAPEELNQLTGREGLRPGRSNYLRR